MNSWSPFAVIERWFDRSRLPTLEDFLAELCLLGLRGRCFTPKDYAQALERHLGLRVRIRRSSEIACLTDGELAVLNGRLVEEGIMGTTKYFRDHDPPWFLVAIADDLDSFLFQYTAHHELGHIAAGHFPAPRLTRTEPIADPVLREEEADLRARYAMFAGSAPELSLQKDSLNQLW